MEEASTNRIITPGGIDRAYIEEWGRNVSKGRIGSQVIDVRRVPLRYHGSQVIMKYDQRQDERGVPKANFLASGEVDEFTQLGPREYILTGLWVLNPESVRLPELNRINSLYDPGRIGYAIFFREMIDGEIEKWTRTKTGSKHNSGSIQRDIDLARDLQARPEGCSPLFLGDSQTALKYIRKEVHRAGLRAIALEPLYRAKKRKA